MSNAFYVYLRDPDGHRVELYTSDYFTGDPDHPVLRWSVRDPRRRLLEPRRDPSWYTEASAVLDLTPPAPADSRTAARRDQDRRHGFTQLRRLRPSPGTAPGAVSCYAQREDVPLAMRREVRQEVHLGGGGVLAATAEPTSAR